MRVENLSYSKAPFLPHFGEGIEEQERIIKAQEEVRNQLARELHDNTAQMLSLIIMNLDLARQLLDKGKFSKSQN